MTYAYQGGLPGLKAAVRMSIEEAMEEEAERVAARDAAWRYEYNVVEVRAGLLGRKMVSEELARLLNQHASMGWQLKAVTATGVGKAPVGPGGTDDGLLLTFERSRQR